MKIKINRTRFLSALNTVKDGIANGELLVLNNILMHTDKDKIVLKTTNLDITVEASVDCVVNEEGDITVPARLIVPMVNAITTEEVEFTNDGSNKSILKGGDVTYAINSISANAFPTSSSFTNPTSLTFQQSEFKQILRKIVYAASVDTTRRTLMGVCFQGQDNKVVAVATDGRRLAKISVDKEIADKSEIIVPLSSLKYVQRLLGTEGEVKVMFDVGNSAKFITDNWAIQTKLVDDKFPAWQQVVPKDILFNIPVAREDMVTAIKQVALSANSESPNIVIMLKNGVMNFSAADQDKSSAKTMIPIKYEGKEISISLNPHYLLDILLSLDCDGISFNVKSESSPITITSDDYADYIAVVMPLRVN